MSGRDETEEERLDRKFDDLLQELRVMQTGAQLTAGFLLTLPFQSSFGDLDDFQRTTYLVLVVPAALTTLFLLSPVVIHRRLSGEHVKDRILAAAQRLVAAAVTTLSLMITGIIFFTFDMVIDRSAALVAGIGIGLVITALLLVLPTYLSRSASPPRS
ncbi:DUF6328 family protein [Nocardioides mangrovi]|uniref:DUF6328 family protein n=1 Tax=Nocardioides mangrovi TaxID=2874580 RepID=A0ABS7UEQ9_9ACTN|nr:DUF6328 family protein [Nocardioides mangrovi]MBZ5739486.1 DUF6328 family protein [Nocardioides mangrovi]